MFRTMLLALCGLCWFSAPSQAFEHEEGTVILDEGIFIMSDWVSVDGVYEGTPGMGGGTMKTYYWMIGYIPSRGAGDFVFDVSDEATYTNVDPTSYPVEEGETLNESGLIISHLYVSIQDCITTIHVDFYGMQADATLVIRGPNLKDIGYDKASYLAYKNAILMMNTINMN